MKSFNSFLDMTVFIVVIVFFACDKNPFEKSNKEEAAVTKIKVPTYVILKGTLKYEDGLVLESLDKERRFDLPEQYWAIVRIEKELAKTNLPCLPDFNRYILFATNVSIGGQVTYNTYNYPVSGGHECYKIRPIACVQNAESRWDSWAEYYEGQLVDSPLNIYLPPSNGCKYGSFSDAPPVYPNGDLDRVSTWIFVSGFFVNFFTSIEAHIVGIDCYCD